MEDFIVKDKEGTDDEGNDCEDGTNNIDGTVEEILARWQRHVGEDDMLEPSDTNTLHDDDDVLEKEMGTIKLFTL